LKPENILIKDEKTISIVLIDFGSSCKQDEVVHSYIQSRFYRSPEVILGLPYGSKINIIFIG
jgi:serine/threonine protein kinase